jgi:hypothetical protein
MSNNEILLADALEKMQTLTNQLSVEKSIVDRATFGISVEIRLGNISGRRPTL